MVAAYQNVLKEDGLNTVTTHQGGQAYEVGPFTRLRRFLILGSEGGSFYVGEQQLTKENATCLRECLRLDPIRAIDVIVDVSHQGLAPKNDAAIFALSMAASYKDAIDPKHTEFVRGYALDRLEKVCRIGTHLFQFLGYVQEQRGWGSGLRRAVAKWYTDKDDRSLANQVLKYQQRNGFSHRDALRLCHAKPTTEDMQAIFKYVVSGEVPSSVGVAAKSGLEMIHGVEFLKTATDKFEVTETIRALGLPRETVPTQWLKDADVWNALLQKMPMEAMVRNLATMSKVGLIVPFSDATKTITERLSDVDRIRKSRLHPIKLLSALRTYQQGHGVRSAATWTVNPQIVSALDAAFYLAFQNVVPAGKNTMLALDVSGSMDWSELAGVPGLTPRVAAAALSLITVSTEPNAYVYTFSSPSTMGNRYASSYGKRDIDLGIQPANIHKGMTLTEVMAQTNNLWAGGTDCSLPMQLAQRDNLPVDAFVVYTDSETGGLSPASVLRKYRQSSGREGVMVVVGMEANQFSLADPKDSRSLDVVGFDSSTPAIISDFIAGRI